MQTTMASTPKYTLPPSTEDTSYGLTRLLTSRARKTTLNRTLLTSNTALFIPDWRPFRQELYL